MAALPIVTSEQESLREPSEEIEEITPEYQKLVKDMIDSMHATRGVGLAGPQIGVNERIAIITQGDSGDEQRTPPEERTEIVIINPKFVSKSDKVVTDDEGCLSVPGVFGPVKRHQEVSIEYQDLKGKKHSLTATGFDARVIQHELDHLDGTLYVDRMDDMSQLRPN